MVRRVIVLLLLGIVLGLQPYEADFLMFDQDGDQMLKYDELRAQFPTQNPYNTADFVAQFFLDYDSNGDKIIEFKEYSAKREQQKLELEQQQKSISSMYHDDL
ncbi:unnamed protein product [Paramecium primaurelia]|uniref:EF-hand domain-containing protein n=1 Tax=Paramecium primaurelia TaxID=5886 RepID=A0A8S1JNZ0_PARPR|nr:unnamed protein product [Paramecium primaurelia]